MVSIALLALAGTVIAALVGTMWYMPSTPMGKIHMHYLGFDVLSKEEQAKKMEEGKKMMGKMYAAQMFLSLLTSLFVVFVVMESVHNGVPKYMAVMFPVLSWLCFVVPTIGSGVLWSNCDRTIVWKKFFSDIFENLAVILLIAFMTLAFV